MVGMKKVSAASIALLLMTSTSSFAQTAKYDTKIAKAAADKVAEKIGDIRKLINYDQIPNMVTKEDLKETKPINTSFLPRASSEAESALPPVSSLAPEIDYTVTGSIKKSNTQHAPRVIWDKFDRYGNLIE